MVTEAQAEARGLGHHYIGTEHLLLGIIRQHDSDAARVLTDRGVDDERARARLTEIVPAETGQSTGQLPFTPRAKKAFELALRESLSHGHYAVAPEHLLLGVLRVDEGVAVRILRELEVDPTDVRDEVLGLLPPPGERRGEAHLPLSRWLGHVHRSGPPQARAGPVLEAGFVLEPSPELRRLLMSAGARALDAGRTEVGIADVQEALRRRADPGEPPTAATA